MKIIVTFRTENLCLPLAGNHILQGFIYRVVSADPRYAAFLHDAGYRAEEKHFKLFLFRPLYGKYTVSGKQITFPEYAHLELRSPSADFIQAFLTACRPGMRFFLQNQPVTVTDCRLENAPLMQENMLVRTTSPITVHRTDEMRHTIYYRPSDADFYELIAENALRKWSSFYGDAPFDFSLEPAENASFRRLITTFKNIYITAWYGDFVLGGSPQVLDFLYHTGLGARNSQGFGMFEPVDIK